MFVVANLILAVAQVLDYVLWAYMWILIARVIISWVNADPDNTIVRFLYSVTDPLLDRVRAALPFFAGGFDFSPIIVWIAILFLRYFLIRSLYDLAYALR